MVRTFLLLSVAAALLPFRAPATGQAAEKLIVGRDTMSLFVLPLEEADSAVLVRLRTRLEQIDAPWSTACWRRYIGLWRLEKGMLWLERVETMEGDPVFTGAELFPGSAEGTRAGADWFSKKIRYGTGETVFYRHDGFLRNLEREWVAAVKKGRVGSVKAYRNRGYKTGAELTDNARRAAEALDSLSVGDLPEWLSLGVVFAADSTGRVVRIDRAQLLLPEKERVSDPSDPRLRAALQAFRAATRWDAWWVEGNWKSQHVVIPLRRGGGLWKPRR